MTKRTVRALAFGFLLFLLPSPVEGASDAFQDLQDELAEARHTVDDARRFSESLSSRMIDNAGSSPDDFMPCSARLSLTSNVPVPTSDQVNQSVLYWIPYQGTKVAVYNGSGWLVYTITNQISLTLSGLTSGKNYDVFLTYNASTSPYFFLNLSNPWTNNTTRADAIVLQDGVYVKSADHTQRFLGSFQATSATTTSDSAANRLLWNFYNRHLRSLSITSAVSSWAGSASQLTWRASDNLLTNSVNFLVGDADAIVFLKAVSLSLDPGLAMAGTGIDSSTTVSSLAYGVNGVSDANTTNCFLQTPGFYYGQPGLGSHTGYWIEEWDNASPTWYGTDGNSSQTQAGMVGWVDG